MFGRMLRLWCVGLIVCVLSVSTPAVAQEPGDTGAETQVADTSKKTENMLIALYHKLSSRVAQIDARSRMFRVGALGRHGASFESLPTGNLYSSARVSDDPSRNFQPEFTAQRRAAGVDLIRANAPNPAAIPVTLGVNLRYDLARRVHLGAALDGRATPGEPTAPNLVRKTRSRHHEPPSIFDFQLAMHLGVRF